MDLPLGEHNVAHELAEEPRASESEGGWQAHHQAARTHGTLTNSPLEELLSDYRGYLVRERAWWRAACTLTRALPAGSCRRG